MVTLGIIPAPGWLYKLACTCLQTALGCRAYEPFTGTYRVTGLTPNMVTKSTCASEKGSLKSDTVEDGIRTHLSSPLINKEFAFPFNVVVILKTIFPPKPRRTSFYSAPIWVVLRKDHRLLFLRFQIEFTSGMPNSIGAWMIL